MANYDEIEGRLRTEVVIIVVSYGIKIFVCLNLTDEPFGVNSMILL